MADITTKLENIKKVMLETLSPKAQQASKHVKPSPAGGQPSVWLGVSGHMITTPDPYDKIIPGIVLGDHSYATKKEELVKLGITHLLNASQGTKFNQINTDQDYFEDSNIKFYGIQNAMDTPKFKISAHFQPTADFIESCLKQKGNVFVHCHQGISRSATIIIAYFMIKEEKTLEAAIKTVRQAREVMPNDGFLKQLILLEDELIKSKT